MDSGKVRIGQGIKALLGVAALVVFSACSALNRSNIANEFAAEPAIAVQTKTQKLIEELPRAKTPIVVSVYSFTDQTGQHKPSELPQYSRAVTQGGLAFLKKALWDAGSQGWFRVLERGGLDHLLKEREIVRTVRASYAAPDGTRLPDLGPLLYAGLLLEGGIVAYESNEITGGAGARYLGIGGSTDYRRDVVTVALRAVSVSNGEVVAAVTTSKTIYSYGLKSGVFKYLTFDELLEGEIGFTLNEPPQLAVRQAIELAVYALIMKGYERKLWTFAKRGEGESAYRQYLQRAGLSAGSAQVTRATAREHAPKSVPQPKLEPKQPSSLQDAVESTVQERKSASLQIPQVCHPDLPKAGAISEGYYFQVASVTPEQVDARPIYEQFLGEGLSVNLQRTRVSGADYCRILIGPYLDLPTAMRQKGLIEAIAGVISSRGHGAPLLRHSEQLRR